MIASLFSVTPAQTRYALPAVLALLAALSACDAPPRPPVPGQEARKAVDAATAAYAKCIEDGARAAAPGRVPGTVVTEVTRACASEREVLAQRVMAFHHIGHPKFTPAQLRVVADASIAQIQPELTAAGVVAYLDQTSPKPKAD